MGFEIGQLDHISMTVLFVYQLPSVFQSLHPVCRKTLSEKERTALRFSNHSEDLGPLSPFVS